MNIYKYIILVQVNEANYGKLKLRKELHKEINRLNHEWEKIRYKTKITDRNYFLNSIHRATYRRKLPSLISN